jgi:hypothetical protein
MFYRSARLFCAAILLGMSLVTVAGWQDFERRARHETVFYPTGFGYKPQVELPEPLEFNVELARFSGRPVYAASLQSRRLEREDLRPLTSGIAGEPLIFERPGEPVRHYLMIEPDLFLRVHQGPDFEPFGKGIALPVSESR